jgi:hypothetical protein
LRHDLPASADHRGEQRGNHYYCEQRDPRNPYSDHRVKHHVDPLGQPVDERKWTPLVKDNRDVSVVFNGCRNLVLNRETTAQ